MKIHASVTTREVDQDTSAIMRSVQEDGEVIPLTSGRTGVPFAYIVPADSVRDSHSAQGLLELVRGRANTKSGRSLRERFHPIPMGGRPAQLLEEMRAEENW